MTDVSAVVVTYNAMPWLERCLESVRGVETVVVDHGSSDGTLDVVRTRFPDVAVIEEENRGLAFGWNTGVAATSGRYVALLNSDAWLDEGALDELVTFADAHPRAALVGPRLRNPDGTLQRSVRGFPSAWRLATEYLFFRKLAPRSRVLNAFYGAGFDHAEPRAVDWVMGAAFLARRAAIDEVGPADDGFFLFSEETDWAWRFHAAGWEVWFDPAAGVTHVYAASHGGRLFRENLRGNLRVLLKHRGVREADRARRVMAIGCLLRGRLEHARWLLSAPAQELVA